MSTEIKSPAFPESVHEGTVATWHKQVGDRVSRDEVLVDIETDKVVLEVAAPMNGVLQEIRKGEGEAIVGSEVLGLLAEGATDAAAPAASGDQDKDEESPSPEALINPAARKLMEENAIDPDEVKSTGKDGRITKEDVLKHLHASGADEQVAETAQESAEAGETEEAEAAPPPRTEEAEGKAASPEDGAPAASAMGAVARRAENKVERAAASKAEKMEAGKQEAASPDQSEARTEKRVPMSRLRARIAERLLQATQSTAMLTTFNEVNMRAVMALRSRCKEAFAKRHEGAKLGFMSFFVRASVEALKRFPAVNASLDGNDVIYHGYQDIGVAVSSPRGLVVPVLRDADAMSFAEIETAIRDFGVKARDGKLAIGEMTGGTFTISNGGVFGSLLSTPILNPPQTAILGMHAIQERPMAVDGKVEILPMMYLALSYDHRMIDGREAVQFLAAIKDLLEDPARIFLEI